MVPLHLGQALVLLRGFPRLVGCVLSLLLLLDLGEADFGPLSQGRVEAADGLFEADVEAGLRLLP